MDNTNEVVVTPMVDACPETEQQQNAAVYEGAITDGTCDVSDGPGSTEPEVIVDAVCDGDSRTSTGICKSTEQCEISESNQSKVIEATSEVDSLSVEGSIENESTVKVDVEEIGSGEISIDSCKDVEDIQKATIDTVTSFATPSTTQSNFVEPMDHDSDLTCANDMIKNLEKSGLGLLSQYDSADDSDDDSVIETPIAENYRSQIVEIDSDSSSDDSDVEITSQIKELSKIIDIGDDDDDDEDGNGKSKKPPRVKGELLLEDLPPIQDLHITVPETECVELGTISSIIDQLVLIKTLPGSLLLNLETILFLEKGQKVLGQIFDVLGQVADPLYCIRFNSNKEIKDKNIEVGQKVYVAPKTEHTQFIILSNLTSIRGSDASWENDVEPPEKHLEYSDDEEEREAKRSMRNKDRPVEHIDLTKRQRPNAQSGPSSLSNSSTDNRQIQRNNREQRFNRPQHQQYGGYNQRQQYGQPNYHHQQQNNFQYDNSGNTWHSNYQYGQSPYYQQPPPSYVVNPYATQPQASYMQGHVMPPQPFYSTPPPPPHQPPQ